MPISFASLMIDVKAEAEGEWIVSQSVPGVSYLVRGFDWGPFQAALNETRTRLNLKHAGDVPDDVAGAALGHLIAEMLLLGWKGYDKPYSPDLAHHLLTNWEYRPLTDDVQDAASRVGRRPIRFVDDVPPQN